jgi:hypothetical protein
MHRSGRALAAAQTIPRCGDVAADVADHRRLIRAAAERNARVLVFPELSLTGCELNLAEGLAFAERDARLSPKRSARVTFYSNSLSCAPDHRMRPTHRSSLRSRCRAADAYRVSNVEDRTNALRSRCGRCGSRARADGGKAASAARAADRLR